MTPELARAAAMDAANRQMRAAGRSAWSEDDYRLACATLGRLQPLTFTDMIPAMDTPKKKNPAAVALGKLGGKVKARKGFAVIDPARVADLARRGVEARKAKRAESHTEAKDKA
jgi:hypothetical protein